MKIMDDSGKRVSKIKRIIFTKLKDRNAREKRFTSVVQLCNSLHESVDFLEKENVRLRVHNTKLENLSIDASKNDTDVTIGTLQKKIYELQQELTELHRSKGEHADQVIEFQKIIDEKEKDIILKKSEAENVKSCLEESTKKRDQLKDKANETEYNLQFVKDEYSALYITHASLQTATEKLEDEHKDLVARWMVYKMRAADELNKENELIQKLKQVKIQKEMEEAIKEPVMLKPGPSRQDILSA